MPAEKIAETAGLRNRLDGTGHDAFETIAGLHLQRVDHRVRGLPDGNHQHAAVRVEIMKVFTNPQHSAITVNVPLKGPINTGFRKRMLEKLARGNAHVECEALAVSG
jgi:hypothetical protein